MNKDIGLLSEKSKMQFTQRPALKGNIFQGPGSGCIPGIICSEKDLHNPKTRAGNYHRSVDDAESIPVHTTRGVV